jgi:hypothetical protein
MSRILAQEIIRPYKEKKGTEFRIFHNELRFKLLLDSCVLN